MQVIPVHTPKITANHGDIFSVLDDALPEIAERSAVAVTSKIVSICEGSIVPLAQARKQELLEQEADLYLPDGLSKYGHHFTITNNTLIPTAGIDESNGEGYHILWPEDVQGTANAIRAFLTEKYAVRDVGVIITDSTCQPLRRGTTGIVLAHSGFKALRDYIGKPDLFGRPFGVTQANVAGGLAAASVVAMGEGAEQTPLCIITDLPTVEFQPRDPTAEELQETTISLEDDLFAPFLESVDWIKGKGR